MKRLIFGGICFLGGLLLLLIIPTGMITTGFTSEHIMTVIAIILSIFGFILSIIGFINKDSK